MRKGEASTSRSFVALSIFHFASSSLSISCFLSHFCFLDELMMIKKSFNSANMVLFLLYAFFGTWDNSVSRVLQVITYLEKLKRKPV